METIFGGLIEFDNKKSFDEYIDNIDNVDSVKVIEMAIQYCHQNGVYTLEESHVLYKCLSKLKEKNEHDIEKKIL